MPEPTADLREHDALLEGKGASLLQLAEAAGQGEARRAPSGNPLGFLIRGLLHWAPVWIPLGLFAQICWMGLRPAIAEHERLLREEAGVEARHEEAERTFERMAAEAEAWGDPVYVERRRRLREAADR